MTDLPIDPAAAASIITHAAATEIMPRFRSLKAHEIREKNPGDYVTDADIGAERVMEAAFVDLLPGSQVVGEEAVSEDPTVVTRLDGDRWVWLIDPVDGTRNFKEGSETFCTMVALCRGGRAHAAWILAPTSNELAMAVAGQGATLDGAQMRPSTVSDPAVMAASIHTQYMTRPAARKVAPGLETFASNKEFYCAGLTYVAVARGLIDVAMFWKAKPWDHAMGALILAEAGGRTAFLDGTDYAPSIRERTGLISTAQAGNWSAMAALLWPE